MGDGREADEVGTGHWALGSRQERQGETVAAVAASVLCGFGASFQFPRAWDDRPALLG